MVERTIPELSYEHIKYIVSEIKRIIKKRVIPK